MTTLGDDACFAKQSGKISQERNTGKKFRSKYQKHTQHLFKVVSGVVAASACIETDKMVEVHNRFITSSRCFFTHKCSIRN